MPIGTKVTYVIPNGSVAGGANPGEAMSGMTIEKEVNGYVLVAITSRGLPCFVMWCAVADLTVIP